MAETVLITGASSGIGLELARCFARGGSNLVLVARTEPKLQELARSLSSEHRINVSVLASDLSQAGAATGIAAEIERGGLQVDVLVNNAGFGERGAVAELGLERQLAMIEVNV